MHTNRLTDTFTYLGRHWLGEGEEGWNVVGRSNPPVHSDQR